MKVVRYSKLFIFTFFLFMEKEAHSCMNEYRALLNGELEFRDIKVVIPTGRLNYYEKTHLRKKLHEVDSIYKKTQSWQDYADLATLLVYNGQYLKAKKIFLEIEEGHPCYYKIAANLGTTYELLGENDSALYWIRRAIQINPNSHKGSEWIHVKILEAKLKAEGNETFLWKYNILSLDFGTKEIPENLKKANLRKLKEHLYYQLEERLSFIQPKDPIVGRLLFDFGNVSAMITDVRTGLESFKLARKYGYTSDVMNKRQAYFETLQLKASVKTGTEEWARENILLFLCLAGTIFLTFVTGLVFLFRHFTKKNGA